MKNISGKTLTLALMILGSVFLTSCSNAIADIQDLVEGEERLSRKDTIDEIKMGIAMNTQVCPGNFEAGMYAIEVVVHREISRDTYIASTVENCKILLTVTPCLGSFSGDALYSTNIYAAVIRACGLEHGEIVL